jgi:hypothetical protein
MGVEIAKAEGAAIARVIHDLITIAKVAMPAELFKVDPRIIRAEALLAKLEGKIQ